MARPWDLEKRRFWGAQLRAWKQSGLTQAEFCRRHGLDGRRLGSWKHRLGMAPPDRPSPVRLIPVTVRPDEAQESAKRGETSVSPLTLVTSGGYRIEVSEGFVPETLAQLLATLGRL